MSKTTARIAVAGVLSLAVLWIVWLGVGGFRSMPEAEDPSRTEETPSEPDRPANHASQRAMNRHNARKSLEKLTANHNVFGAAPDKKAVVSKKGGLATRLFPDEEIGRVFQRHKIQATFVVLNPARYRHKEAYRAMLARLVRMGHDVGYWDARSASCIQLYDPNDLADFRNLDRDPEVWDSGAGAPLRDEYGCPKTGIAEVIVLKGETYLGLTNVMKYQSDDDVVVRPIHGTDRIAIENIPVSRRLCVFYVYFPEGETLVPEAVRGKWVCAGVPSQQSPIEKREFPVNLYEAIRLRDYTGGDVFSNPSGRTFTTRVALHMKKQDGVYTDYLHIPEYASYPNQRARLYKYIHALRSFNLMGLPRPFTVGEPRCKYEDYCLSEAPLKQLGYDAGGVDPLHKGHTYYMQDNLRYRFSTSGGPRSTEPIDPTGRSNGIGFNRNYFDQGEGFDYVGFALSRIAQAAAQNRIILERQTRPYTDRERAFWDRLLQKCSENGIPVLSMRQAAIMLFDRPTGSGNPVPRMDIDRDGDGLPDGYHPPPPGSEYEHDPAEGTKVSGFHHFKRKRAGDLFSIKWMGGIKPGKNKVTVWARGTSGDVIRIKIKLYVYEHVDGDRYGKRTTATTVDLPVTLTASDWKRYDAGEIDKHPNCYFNDIDVSVETAQGTLYVSQIEVQ